MIKVILCCLKPMLNGRLGWRKNEIEVWCGKSPRLVIRKVMKYHHIISRTCSLAMWTISTRSHGSHKKFT